MKKSILFSVLVVGATLLQAQSITVHQTCGQNGQVIKAIPDAIDLGLSVNWADMNVGAKYIEDYGNYYAWGETSTKETYNRDTYFDGQTYTKYNYEGGKTVLDPEDDAAYVNWGDSWRMPTKAEWQELIDSCTWTWTTQNGINGYKVTSNKEGYTDKFIFLPAAGGRSGNGLYDVGSFGYYWSSSLYNSYLNNAWDLYFLSSGYHSLRNYYGFIGRSVRPVLQPSSISYSSSATDTIRIYSNGCDDYQTFIGSHGDQLTMSAQSDQWSHFVRWNDGNTDNPRTITTNGNADYTAYFETYRYSVRVQSDDAARGSAYISKVVKGDTIEYNDSVGSFEAGSEVFLAYQANYGYHFDKWSDGNKSQQRSFILTKDTTFTATFAKNVYSITKNAEHGSISGDTSAEYLDEVTLTANPDYGYHFTQWSDGVKDNPRTIVLTQDTTFAAEFAIDRTGTCGDDNALIWMYDAETKTLTITGNGTLNSNYTFGVEAPTQMQKLVIGNEITSIGDSAFYGKSTINHLIIGGSVATIGNYAFAECRNFDDITCYATIVPTINATTFENVGNKQYIYLYVPEDCERAYHRDEFWGEFDIRIKGTEETTTDTKSVTVEPADNTALFIWPIDDNAASYSLQITKDGVVFCTLVFNSNGQLTGIAFAPSRNGSSHAPAATTSVAGMSFTVTGLNVASKYAYRLAVADDASKELVAYSGEFATTGYDGEVNPGGNPEGIEDVFTDEHKASKILHNGQIYILRGEKVYTLQGQEVK